MPRVPIWRRYLRFWGADVSGDVDDELLFHIEEKIRELAATGLPPKEARREALRQFGSLGAVRRECEQIDKRHQTKAERRRYLADWWQDVQYALRMLRKNPGFTAVAVLSLALGLGANTAIFSVVNAVLLRPLPYPEAGRLVWVAISFPSFHDEMMPGPDYVEWSRHNHTFTGMAAYASTTCDVTGGASPERIRCGIVTQNFLPILRVQPVLGRGFLPSEDQPGGPQVAILSYGFWQRRFGGSRAVLGKAITLDSESRAIVGVMPRGFRFPGDLTVELLRPQQLDSAGQLKRHMMLLLHAVGRLKPGVSLAGARADLEVLLSQTRKRFPMLYRQDNQVHLVSLQEHEVGNVRLTLLLLLSAVGCLLLIACANVTNLLLAHGAARQREIAVRSAIGASRARLVRQLLTESALLAMLGGAAGLLLAGIVTKVLVHSAPNSLPRVDQVSIDGYVLLFTFAVSLMTGLLFGLAPAIHAGRSTLNEALKEGIGRTGTTGGGSLRGGLVIAELALSLVLLTGAGLLLQSLWRLENVHLGFQPDQVITTQITLHDRQRQQVGFWEDLLRSVARIPGVAGDALAAGLPPRDFYMMQIFSRAGYPPPERGHRGDNVLIRPVSPAYFLAMGIPLRQGRLFEAGDKEGAPLVTIVNETLARHYFPNENPIGMRILGQVDHDWRTIVGVVSDAKNRGLESAVEPEAYEPYSQVGAIRSMSLIVRTPLKPEYLIPLVRDQIRAVNRDVPLTFQTMDDNLSGLVSRPRFNTALFSIFAALALLLAGIGTYGVLAYSVAQRTQEIGIRMALGATTSTVLRLVVGKASVLAAAGIVVGVSAAYGLTRYLSSLLFEVKPDDPLTFIAVSLLLAAIALAASWIPARRAVRVDPAVALRCE